MMKKDYKGKLREEEDLMMMMNRVVVRKNLSNTKHHAARWRRGIHKKITGNKHLVLLLVALVLLLTTTTTTLAFAPPKPGSDHPEWNHLNVTRYSYSPTNLHPELCRYMSEEECRHADASMKQQHLTHSQQQHRHLEANPNFSLNVLVLLMQFKDHSNRELPEPYEAQLLMNLRVSKYLEVNSYGRYKVWFDVIPWQMTDDTELHYSFDVGGRTLDFQPSFHPLLDQLYNEGLDWSIYDSNNDGILDNLIILTSSYPAEVGGQDCTNGRQDYQRIWSHALADVSRDNWVSPDGSIRTNAYTVASAFHGTCGNDPALAGVVTHEYFHAIYNLPDLYDTAKDPETGEFLFRGRGGVGTFDIMANPYGVGGDDEDFPTHLSAWSKIQMGWLEPLVLNGEGSLQTTYTIRPSELYPDVLRINLENFLGNEYLLVENRQRKYFDIKLFGTGILMYHVDDSLKSQSYRGYPGQDGWPNNANHYQVAVLQQDGEYHLERGQNRGDELDFWTVGTELLPGDGETYPNSDTYGTLLGVFPSGVEVRVLDQVGDDMIVSVVIPSELMGAAPPRNASAFATPQKEPTDVISGKFEAGWFQQQDDEIDGAPQQSIGTGEAQMEDRPQQQLPVGTGEAEREDVFVVPATSTENNGGEPPTEVTNDGGGGGVLFATIEKEPDVTNDNANATGTIDETDAGSSDGTSSTSGGLDESVFANLFVNNTATATTNNNNDEEETATDDNQHTAAVPAPSAVPATLTLVSPTLSPTTTTPTIASPLYTPTTLSPHNKDETDAITSTRSPSLSPTVADNDELSATAATMQPTIMKLPNVLEDAPAFSTGANRSSGTSITAGVWFPLGFVLIMMMMYTATID